MATSSVIQFNVAEKVCTMCKVSKPTSSYSRHNASSDGLRPRCKDCVNASYRSANPKVQAPGRKVKLSEDGRNCLSCKKTKAWSEFHTDIHGFNGRAARCRACRNENYKDPRGGSHVARPDKVKRMYGVSYEHVVQTLANQFGRCANLGCCKEISLETKGTRGNRAVIDHCHTTGKFRALLCINCNSVLGVLETQNTKILGLMDYMNKHKNN